MLVIAAASFYTLSKAPTEEIEAHTNPHAHHDFRCCDRSSIYISVQLNLS